MHYNEVNNVLKNTFCLDSSRIEVPCLNWALCVWIHDIRDSRCWDRGFVFEMGAAFFNSGVRVHTIQALVFGFTWGQSKQGLSPEI